MTLIFPRTSLPLNTFNLQSEMKKDLSICLVNWNTCSLLRKCIQSILENHDDLHIELFVIDNASTDGSAQMVAKEFPQVNLIKNKRNIGFAKANNQGIFKSTGRYVLLLNPDTLVLPGSLKKMVEFLETHPDTGAVAPKLLNSDGSLQYSIRKFPTVLTPFTENLNLFHVPFIKRYTSISHLMNWDHESICEVDQPAGAAFMLKRSVIETLGVLDNAYHMFFEDVDLCYRIKRNGWKIYYLPDAQIIHYGGQSVKQSVNIGDEFYKSMLKYFRRHHGSWREKKVRIVMILGSVVYLFFAAFTFFKSPRQAYNLAKSAIKVFRYAFRFKHSGYALSTEDMQLC